jgi:restriction endonuclease S subunit
MEVKPGYKQTEVGVIPEDWVVRQLADFAEFLSSKRIFESDYVSMGVPFYRGTEVTLLIENKMLPNVYFIAEERYTEILQKYGVPIKGDILITSVGTLGNVYFIPDNRRFYFKDGNLIWLRGVSGIDGKYFAIQIQSRKKEIVDNAIGSTQKALTIVILKKTLIPVPPTKAEQEAIAEVLSDADAFIQSLEQLIAKKRHLKQGAMQELLTGKRRLPGFVVKEDYKQTEVGVIPEDWRTMRLQSLLSQPATYGVVKAGMFQRRGIPMLRGGDIKGGRVNTDLPLISLEKSAEYQRTVLRNGDIVIALVGYPGEAAVIPEALGGANISRAVGLLRPSNALNAGFLTCYLNSNSGRREFLKPGAGSAQMVVNLRDLNLLWVPLPPTKSEQGAIAEALSDMDAEIAALEAKLTKAHQIKQGMMQELLTGRMRLL